MTIVPAPARLEPGEPLGDEGYRLEVRDGRAHVDAETDAGRFYAEQTLRRLPPGDVAIADRPRFAWRGFMLDVARHFFGVEDVCRLIDQLAAYKLNVLHLHLSDDQGWRIAIDSWPRLAEHGGSGAVGGGPGGFYTRDDMRAIVRYAAERFVTVVPEIDTPGHVQAALASYPELGAPGSSSDLYGGVEVGFSSLDVHSALTYRFLDDVFRELAALTPGPFLHIGGDEAHSTSHGDYLAFMERVQPVVAAHGKRLAGWEEIASAPLGDGAVVQYWTASPRGHELARAAVAQGAQLVMSPADRVYLDMKYDAETPLGQDWAGHVEVRDSYDWDPAALVDGVGEDAILGVEAPLWTETLTTLRDLETMTFPRLCAVAEVAWSQQAERAWEDFRARLAAEGPRWDATGVAYHRSPQVDWR